MIFTTLLMVL